MHFRETSLQAGKGARGEGYQQVNQIQSHGLPTEDLQMVRLMQDKVSLVFEQKRHLQSYIPEDYVAHKSS